MDRSHRWLDRFDPNSAYARAMGDAIRSEYAVYAELPLEAPARRKYLPTILAAGVDAAMIAVEQIIQVPELLDVFPDQIQSNVRFEMRRMWSIVRWRAVADMSPDVQTALRDKGRRRMLPDEYRALVLAALSLMRLGASDRVLMRIVAQHAGPRGIVKDKDWQEIARAMQVLRDDRESRGEPDLDDLTLTPHALEERHRRIQKRMQEEKPYLDRIVKLVFSRR